jgi:thiamine biosynthesis lipoprotein
VESGEGAAVERSHLTMGSEVRVTAWTRDEAGALAAFHEAFAEFDRLDALMSIWRDGSEVQRLNAAAGERPVPVGPEVRDVLLTAQQVSEWTGGAFDVTFAALSDIWRFDHDRDGRVPSPAEIAARLPLVDYSAVRLDGAAGTAFLAREGMRVHLGGVGKGYAVDRAAAILRSRNVGDFMIHAGGDLYVAGRRGDRPWRVGIRDPRGPEDRVIAAMDLTDATFSTSGDYERSFVRDGRRYHHIIDPDTGQPARRSRSVTIIARNAAVADALATGIFIMGPESGLELIERLPDVEGVIVGADNVVSMSSGLRERLAMVAQPTDAP